MAYMHGRNLAHFDLKPENFLLTLEEPACVKIADFGVAKGRRFCKSLVYADLGLDDGLFSFLFFLEAF